GAVGQLEACALHAADELLTLIRLPVAILLDDQQLVRGLDTLIARVTPLTCETFAAAPNDRAALGRTRINHLVLLLFAIWTPHDVTASSPSAFRNATISCTGAYTKTP